MAEHSTVARVVAGSTPVDRPNFMTYDDIFNKPCWAFPHKKRYGTESAAESMIERLLGEARLHSYHCKSCQGWHLSSSGRVYAQRSFR